MAILVATINYSNAISPQFTFMFPNLTETKRMTTLITQALWHATMEMLFTLLQIGK